MNKDKALQHMIAWALQNIYETQKAAQAILDDKDLAESDKVLKLRGENGYDYNLLKLLILLNPVIEIAQEEYPDHVQFFEWLKERWAHVMEKKYVSGACGCKGCCKKD